MTEPRRVGPGKLRLGLIVNPAAGMGGRLGLKGTDGWAFMEALARGAKPVSPSRAARFIAGLRPWAVEEILAPPGIMGGEALRQSILYYRIIDCVPLGKWPTEPSDTVECARVLRDEGVDLLVFVGGDGTARDIYRAVGGEAPVLGVPSGVKVYSAVFASSPEAAARVVNECSSRGCPLGLREVLDIDEEAFRSGILDVKLYGYMLTPISGGLVASGKQASPETLDEEANKRAIAEYIAENMEDCRLYILGPGTTVAAIAEALGVEKTLLGVDVIHNRRLIARDVDAQTLKRILREHPRATLIVTPIGGQGFILGRGNQQISPEALRIIGRENIIVIATRSKIEGLKELLVDTGDPEVDAMLEGYIRVLVDYNQYVVRRVVAPR